MKNKIKKIKVVALDVDGVLTDGKIVYDTTGKEIKFFDVQDGYGLVLLRRAGLKTAIISAKKSKAVDTRAKDLKIDKVYQNAYPKLTAFKCLLKEMNVKPDEVCFVGDDLPDLVVLKRVGFAVAVKNAAGEVKKHADYITKKNGGSGAVREVAELILRNKGQWNNILSACLK